MEVLVFKTNIASRNDIQAISRQLQAIDDVMHWTVDLQDVDRVLRVEANSNSPRIVEESLRRAGYWCQEMED